MRAIDLASAIQLAGPDSEWVTGSALTWTSGSDDVLALLARRRQARTHAVSSETEGEPATEERVEATRYRSDLASLVLRESGLNAALHAMLHTSGDSVEPALLRLLAQALAGSTRTK